MKFNNTIIAFVFSFPFAKTLLVNTARVCDYRLAYATVEVIAVLLHPYRVQRPSVMTLRMCPSLLLNIAFFVLSKRKYR